MTFSNRVNWSIDPKNAVLLIHDMQTHYLTALSEPARATVVENVRRIVVACLEHDVPIFASQVPCVSDPHERGLMLDMWGIGPLGGLRDLDPGLGLKDGAYRLLTKRSYSAFFGNDFEALVRRLEKSSIIVTGVYTSIGCATSAMDAFMRDIKAFVVADGTADFSKTDHDLGLSKIAQTCAKIVSTAEVLTSLG